MGFHASEFSRHDRCSRRIPIHLDIGQLLAAETSLLTNDQARLVPKGPLGAPGAHDQADRDAGDHFLPVGGEAAKLTLRPFQQSHDHGPEPHVW
jgi:hypothetical protein